MKYLIHTFLIVIVFSFSSYSQKNLFTKEDTLKGSNTVFRSWWDVLHYQISVKPDFLNKSISGNCTIRYKVISDTLDYKMQIDLQDPLIIDSFLVNGLRFYDFIKKKDRWVLNMPSQVKGNEYLLIAYYHGKPKVAKNAPWDGGFVWKKDSLGNPWMSVACQGVGASVWFPCKDLQSEEPDFGATLTLLVPDTLIGIGNGKLIDQHVVEKGQRSYTWKVMNTINSYDIIPYIGKYSCIHDSIIGEKGVLITDYWVLDYHIAKVQSHLKTNVINTLKCLEHWFGSYPFYDDTYKIVEAPYLGMEHQSNIAYGNLYLNGYAGIDLSNSGWGLKWDFIVVHETAHEWFGNSVTAMDVADNWIHEGFASYAEVLFTEYFFGKEAANDYSEGIGKKIENDIPLIGIYGVKKEGSGDIYNKGSRLIHMIRQLVNDDEKFRSILRDLSSHFYHKIITTKEFEDYLSKKSGKSLKPLFDQYLRSTKIPILEYKLLEGRLDFRYTNCVEDFNMPLKITANKEYMIQPTTQWQSIVLEGQPKTISIDRNMYIELKTK
jgi:aminopeptidase N